MTVLKPDFLLPNYINPIFNEDASITLSPTLNWHQDNKKYLYDNTAGNQINIHNFSVLYSNNADDDAIDVEIKVDLGSILEIGVIRLCNTNAKYCKIEISTDDSTYTTLQETTDSSSPFISWYALNETVAYADFGYYLTTDKGKYIVTSSGEKIELSIGEDVRYIKITINETQEANSEKYIGELYIGDLYCRPRNVSLMSDAFTDNNSVDLIMYNNKSNRKINRATLSQSISLHRPNILEFTAIKNFINYGFLMNYAPNPIGLEDFTNNFDGREIYLVQARNESFSYQSFGRNANGSVSFSLKEAAIVTRKF